MYITLYDMKDLQPLCMYVWCLGGGKSRRWWGHRGVIEKGKSFLYIAPMTSRPLIFHVDVSFCFVKNKKKKKKKKKRKWKGKEKENFELFFSSRRRISFINDFNDILCVYIYMKRETSIFEKPLKPSPSTLEKPQPQRLSMIRIPN